MNDINVLDNEIALMLKNKTNKSEEYIMPKKLSKKAYNALRELEKNHDHGWSVELFLRNKNNLDKEALRYRGNKITYEQMFTKAYEYAKSFKQMGLKKGDEVPVLVSNSPEYVYTFLALNFIGVTMNTVGSWFNRDYLKQIFIDTNSKYIFVSDDNYEVLKDIIDETDNLKTVVAFSLTDSLMKDANGKSYNPYAVIDDKFHAFSNQVDMIKKTSSKEVLDQTEFLKLGENYQGKIVEDMILDDIASITYTSGTTKPGYPKGCRHSNLNYIAISRFKEADVSTMSEMKDLVALASLPSYTQTILTTAYSDPLYLGCSIALEPIGGSAFFPYSLIINKPNYTVQTPGCYMELCKKLDTDPAWQKVNMPYLLIPTIVGEPTSAGEEKYANYVARTHKFGTDKLPFGMTSVFSFGGGSTENGGIFVTLFKSWQEKKLNYLLHKDPVLLQALALADVQVLNDKKEICQPNEVGILTCNSPCNQVGYVDPKQNKGMTIIDANGEERYSGGAYALKDKYGNFRIVGRPNTDIKCEDGRSIPLFKVLDAIDKDTKNILTTVVVELDLAGQRKYVCHIEKQPHSKNGDAKVMAMCAGRLKQILPEDVLNNVYFRMRDSFPLAPSDKRDNNALRAEGISDKCVAYNQLQEKNMVKVKKYV